MTLDFDTWPLCVPRYLWLTAIRAGEGRDDVETLAAGLRAEAGRDAATDSWSEHSSDLRDGQRAAPAVDPAASYQRCPGPPRQDTRQTGPASQIAPLCQSNSRSDVVGRASAASCHDPKASARTRGRRRRRCPTGHTRSAGRSPMRGGRRARARASGRRA